MRAFAVVLCALVACAVASPTGQGRIIGGNQASPGQIVHQGFVEDYNGDYVCGTWIHSRYYAIAPAYYMQNRMYWDAVAVFGALSTENDGTRHAVTEIIVHPNFNANTLDNNIAVLYIQDGIYFEDYMHPIPLGTEYTPGGIWVNMAGWSRNQTEMHYLTTRTLTNSECQARHAPENRDRITERVICVDTVEGEGGCQSSAGNALIAGNIVIGSFSWGIDCTEGAFPDVYIRMSYYNAWLNSVIGDYDLD